MINAPSGFGNLANAAGHALAAYLKAWANDTPAFRRFRDLKAGPDPDLGQGRYYRSARHRTELDAWKLLKALNFLRARLEPESVAPSRAAPGPLRRILEDVAAHRISEEAALNLIEETERRPAAPAAIAHARAASPRPVPDGRGHDLKELLLDQVVEELVALLHVPKAELDVTMPLSEFGVDSILASEIINGVKRRYGVSLPPTVLFEYRDIRSFVEYLAVAHRDTIGHILTARQSDAAQEPHEERGLAGEPVRPLPSGNTRDLEALWSSRAEASADENEVEVIRDGDGAPILFIGGLGTTWEIWKAQITWFQNERQIVVYHPPGHGNSGYDARRFGLEQMADDVGSLLEQVGGGAPVPIVGWSLGGVIATTVAVRHPKRVRALVLACTTAWPRAALPAGEALFGEILARPGGREQIASVSGALSLKPKVLAHYKRLLGGCDLRHQLASILAPTLVLAGAKDSYMSPALAHDLQQGIAGARYHEFAQAGHFPMLTVADEFTRVIAGFLGEHDGVAKPLFAVRKR